MLIVFPTEKGGVDLNHLKMAVLGMIQTCNSRALESVEYLVITITPRTTLILKYLLESHT